MTSKSSKAARTASAAQTSYEGSVIARGMARAGRNPHLKGHIHEVLAKDGKNITSMFQGQATELTKSTTATTVDLVTTKGGKVVERLQLKDTLSSSEVSKLVRRVAAGEYRTAQLVGTDETCTLANSALKKAGLAKRMSSSGISSRTTTSLAQRAGATGSGSLGGAIGQAAKSGGAVGAAVGAGVEVIVGVKDLINGKRDFGDVAVSTAKAGAKGYVTGAAASAAATATGAAMSTGLGLAGIGASTAVAASVTFAAPIVVAIGAGWVITKVFDGVFG